MEFKKVTCQKLSIKTNNFVSGEKMVSNFSPSKYKTNFSPTSHKLNKINNSSVNQNLKNSNYFNYVSIKNSKNVRTTHRKLKDSVDISKENKRESHFNASKQNSISISSFIRDENNSLHNSIEKIPHSTQSINKNSIDFGNKNKILVLDYKEKAVGSRNVKPIFSNQSLNISNQNLTHIHNLKKSIHSNSIQKDNSNNLILKSKKSDSISRVPIPISSKYITPKNANSKLTMFKTKSLVTSTNSKSNSKLKEKNSTINNTIVLKTNESMNVTLQNTIDINKTIENARKINKKTMSNDSFNQLLKPYHLNKSIDRKKTTVEFKDNSLQKKLNHSIYKSVEKKEPIVKPIFKKKIPNKSEIFQKPIPLERKVTNEQQQKTLQIKKKNDCFTPKEIIEKFVKYLNSFEKEEIMHYPEIYYCGKFVKNKQQMIKIEANSSNLANSICNNTSTNEEDKITVFQNEIYKDDDQGNFTFKKGDQIYYRYEIINELGRGSFGIALKCFDHKTKEYVCVKVVKNKKKVLDQAKIEIKILEYIKSVNKEEIGHVVKIQDNFSFRNHICIVFELLDMNLYELIKNLDFQGIDLKQLRKIAIQILETLVFLKKNRIIHCDLKPENILIKNFSKAKINVIDFGSSCFENEKLYSYLQSRFYRAPEVILGTGYGIEIDMWSFGCIIAELFAGIPIFPGESSLDQINYIMEYIGEPPSEIIEVSRKKLQFFDELGKPLKIPNSKGKIRLPNTKKFEKFLKDSSDDFIDLVKRCLVWDPRDRITPFDAMNHPFIIGNRNDSKIQNSQLVRETSKEKKTSSLKINESVDKSCNNSFSKNGNNENKKINLKFSLNNELNSKDKKKFISIDIPLEKGFISTKSNKDSNNK